MVIGWFSGVLNDIAAAAMAIDLRPVSDLIMGCCSMVMHTVLQTIEEVVEEAPIVFAVLSNKLYHSAVYSLAYTAMIAKPILQVGVIIFLPTGLQVYVHQLLACQFETIIISLASSPSALQLAQYFAYLLVAYIAAHSLFKQLKLYCKSTTLLLVAFVLIVAVRMLFAYSPYLYRVVDDYLAEAVKNKDCDERYSD